VQHTLHLIVEQDMCVLHYKVYEKQKLRSKLVQTIDRRIINEWIHMSKMLPTELMSAYTVTYKGNLFDGVVNLLYIKAKP